jgi:hypothetical protein
MAQHASELERDVLLRVRGEYLEMPGLRLTPAQAQRLWGVGATAAQSVIDTLVDARFLRPVTAPAADDRAFSRVRRWAIDDVSASASAGSSI